MTTKECINVLIGLRNSNFLSKEVNEALYFAIIKMQEKEPKLEQCKKCGAYAGRIIRYSHSKCRCSCTNCGYATKLKDSVDDAVFAWNQQPYKKQDSTLSDIKKGKGLKPILNRYVEN